MGQDIGSFSKGSVPKPHVGVWEQQLEKGYKDIIRKHPKVENSNTVSQIGTLGGGNHFIELCLDEDKAVWIMLHSGSRGAGNKIGIIRCS